MRELPRTQLKVSYLATAGGEDLITPALQVNPGRAMLTRNYELDQFGRYRLVDGYEIFDGQAKPSDASYWVISFDAGTAAIAANNTIVGGTSAATGVVLAVVITSGSWAGGDAAGTIVFTALSGTFQDNEDIELSTAPGVGVALANGVASERGAAADDDNSYLIDAQEYARDQIAAVPGSGSILGGWTYKGVKYAFRNNAGATAAVMHKSSTSGWTACDLGRTLAFTTGVAEIAENNVITGAISGATAIVKRVIVTSGTWAGGDAAGRLIIYAQVGTFQAENITVSAAVVAAIGANSVANALPAGGRYECLSYNFGGHASTQRMYGCNGVGTAFEWDGNTFVPLPTGMSNDKPNHIIAHKNHVFLLFPGGSVQHSSISNPYEWSAVTGAAEIGVGDEGTGFLSVPNLLAVFSRNSTRLLYGSGSASWEMTTHSDEVGATEWTIQRVGSGIFLDDRGLTSLAATDAYGDFQANTISKSIEPWLKTMMSLAVCSVRVKEKNQYRLYFSDGHGMCLTLSGDKVVGFTRTFYDDIPVCCWSAENLSGEEEMFFGDASGNVYQLDSGTTFNGEPIEALIMFHFNHLKTPSVKKRTRKMTLIVDAPVGTRLSAGIEFDYGESGNSGYALVPVGKGGIWDVDTWGEFIWDGTSDSSLPIHIDGTGVNFGLSIYHSGEYGGLVLNAGPHTIQGYIIHYNERGVQR